MAKPDKYTATRNKHEKQYICGKQLDISLQMTFTPDIKCDAQ